MLSDGSFHGPNKLITYDLGSIENDLDKFHITSDSEYDEISCYWIQLKEFSDDESVSGSLVRPKLTLPGCCMEQNLVDRVGELISKYPSVHGNITRSVLNADSVTQDEKGVHQLISAGCHRAAVNLTGRLLESYGQGFGRKGQPSKHTLHSIKLWSIRMALLVQLREFTVATQEASAWKCLETPDLYLQYYKELYGNRRGSMIPFCFRVLLAELPRYIGQYKQSLENLFHILNVCNAICEKLSSLQICGSESQLAKAKLLWQNRKVKVLSSVFNCYLSINDYHQALWALECILECQPSKTVPLLSAMGRVHLQRGDMRAARQMFDRVATRGQQQDEGNEGRSLKGYVRVNTALLLLSEGDSAGAVEQLTVGCEEDPACALLVSNMAVCQLYRGDLQTAVTTLETLVFSHARFLQETLLFNLCTLYELQTAKCNRKKLELLAHVAKHAGDGFNIGCLKLLD